MPITIDDIIQIQPETLIETSNQVAVSPRDLAARLKGSSIELIDRMTKEIDQPVFKQLAKDLLGTLSSFYDNEEALCCLIKNLITIKEIDDIREKYLKEDENTLIVQIQLPFIEHTIVLLDVIITFLELDIKDLVIPFLDFAKLLAEAIVGALIMILQQIVFTLRDTTIAWVCQELSKIQQNEDASFLKCLPFVELIEIIKRYMSDYGLLAKLMNMISGFIGGKHKQLSLYLKADLPKNLKLIEFLKAVRRILELIKGAILEWDLCVDQSFSTPDKTSEDKDGDDKKPFDPFGSNYKGTGDMNTGTPATKDSVLADNNSILSNANGIKYKGNGLFVLPSDADVKQFLHKYVGLSENVAEYFVSTDDRNQQGTLSQNPSSTNSDCGYTLQQTDVYSILKGLLRK